MKVTNHDLKLDADAMSIRAKSWPRIYMRRYPSGRVKWVVDLGKQGEKNRDRRYFDNKAEAEGFAQAARAARINQGELPFVMPPADQAAAVRLYKFLRPYGIAFDQVQQHYATDVIPYLEAPTVAEIVDALIQAVASKRRDSTVRSLKSILGEFRLRFGSRKITDVAIKELEDFCLRSELKQGNAPGTQRGRLNKVSQLYNFAIKKGWATKNLVASIDLPPGDDDKEPEFLTIDECSRLLVAADESSLLGYFVLALFLGIRPTELKRLDWSDVHIDDGLVVIYKAAAKIHDRREIPINSTAAAWLERCRRRTGPVVSGVNFQGRFVATREAAKMTRWPKDVMRHTFATYHSAAFKNDGETARQMGHIGGLRILRKHYVAYVPETIAKQFWALMPTKVIITTMKEAA